MILLLEYLGLDVWSVLSSGLKLYLDCMTIGLVFFWTVTPGLYV
jgi:hypothetical protein